MRLTAWRFAAIASLGFAAIAATRPHYGGTLRAETQSRAASLDPAESGTQENMTALVFDRLVSWSDTAQPQPALASSWRHDAGFKLWEFQLRPGVKFHDGSPVTAQAAAAALARLGAVAVGDTLVVSLRGARAGTAGDACRRRSIHFEAVGRWRADWHWSIPAPGVRAGEARRFRGERRLLGRPAVSGRHRDRDGPLASRPGARFRAQQSRRNRDDSRRCAARATERQESLDLGAGGSDRAGFRCGGR